MRLLMGAGRRRLVDFIIAGLPFIADICLVFSRAGLDRSLDQSPMPLTQPAYPRPRPRPALATVQRDGLLAPLEDVAK